MLGSDASHFFTPEDPAHRRLQVEMERPLREGRAADERWHLRRGGERFWASGEMMPLRDNSGVHLGRAGQSRVRDNINQLPVLGRRLSPHGECSGGFQGEYGTSFER